MCCGKLHVEDGMRIVDKYRFESRSRGGCSNSDYLLQRTSCCGRYCVEDDELSDLYFDSGDPSRRITLLRLPSDPPIPCPCCGALEWELREVTAIGEAPEEWSWAYHET